MVDKYIFSTGFTGFQCTNESFPYIASLNSTTTNTSAKYRQLLAEAEAMAATFIDESNNPAIQRERITEAWKLFLDKLAEVYQIEVKERFG